METSKKIKLNLCITSYKIFVICSSKTEQNSDERKGTKRKIEKPEQNQTQTDSKTTFKQADAMSVKKREEFAEKLRAEKDLLREKERAKTENRITSGDQSTTKENSRLRLKENQNDQWSESRESARNESSRSIISEKEKRRKLNADDDARTSSTVQKRSTESSASPNSNLFGCEAKRVTDKKRRVDSSPRESPQYFEDRRRGDNSHVRKTLKKYK